MHQGLQKICSKKLSKRRLETLCLNTLAVQILRRLLPPPWLATPEPKSGLQLTMPKPSFGYKPPSLLGGKFKLNMPNENKKKLEELPLQKKLNIGASNDPLEHEADRVADQVMSMQPNTTVNKAPVRIQRYSGQPNQAEGTAPASVDHVLSSTGRPLEPSLRNDMEQRFGHDFSHVRLHTGGAGEQSARDVNANAYTVGSNVVFGAGQFAPQTQSGKRLLAHELTHVVQQSINLSDVVQRETTQKLDEEKDNTSDEDYEDYKTGADSEVYAENDTVLEEDGLDTNSEQMQSGGSTAVKSIKVILPNKLVRYEGSKEISTWAISGGKAGHETPTGPFTINARDENHTSSSYGKCDGKKVGPNGAANCKGKYEGADMHYFQGFAPAVGFHRGSPSVLSHGCIHVNGGNAKTLWDWSGIGTPVKVSKSVSKKKKKIAK